MAVCNICGNYHDKLGNRIKCWMIRHLPRIAGAFWGTTVEESPIKEPWKKNICRNCNRGIHMTPQHWLHNRSGSSFCAPGYDQKAHAEPKYRGQA